MKLSVPPGSSPQAVCRNVDQSDEVPELIRPVLCKVQQEYVHVCYFLITFLEVSWKELGH